MAAFEKKPSSELPSADSSKDRDVSRGNDTPSTASQEILTCMDQTTDKPSSSRSKLEEANRQLFNFAASQSGSRQERSQELQSPQTKSSRSSTLPRKIGNWPYHARQAYWNTFKELKEWCVKQGYRRILNAWVAEEAVRRAWKMPPEEF